jgi:hypothetical protein
MTISDGLRFVVFPDEKREGRAQENAIPVRSRLARKHCFPVERHLNNHPYYQPLT